MTAILKSENSFSCHDCDEDRTLMFAALDNYQEDCDFSPELNLVDRVLALTRNFSYFIGTELGSKHN